MLSVLEVHAYAEQMDVLKFRFAHVVPGLLVCFCSLRAVPSLCLASVWQVGVAIVGMTHLDSLSKLRQWEQIAPVRSSGVPQLPLLPPKVAVWESATEDTATELPGKSMEPCYEPAAFNFRLTCCLAPGRPWTLTAITWALSLGKANRSEACRTWLPVLPF